MTPITSERTQRNGEVIKIKKIISSKKIAKRTKTQEGKTSRGATFSEKEDIQYLVQDDHSYGP